MACRKLKNNRANGRGISSEHVAIHGCHRRVHEREWWRTMKRKPYREGDWFAEPVCGAYIIGRIARVGRRGRILLGYFFEPLRDALPGGEEPFKLSASDAFNIEMFGDLGLIEDGWPIIPNTGSWNRDEWPMPRFGRLDSFRRNRGYSVQYDENDPSRRITEDPTTAECALRLPSDGLSGHIALQSILERYFTEGHQPYRPEEIKREHRWFHGLPEAEE